MSDDICPHCHGTGWNDAERDRMARQAMRDAYLRMCHWAEEQIGALDARRVCTTEERAAALEAVAEAVHDWIANGGRESITYSQRLREYYSDLLATGWRPKGECDEQG